MTPPEDPITPELVALIRAGDREAFERLFRAWYRRLADHAARMLGNQDAAEDAVQDVFVAVWDKRAGLPEAAKIPAYLYRAVRNRSLNQIRQQKTRGRWLETQNPDPSMPAAAETDLQASEIGAKVQEALAELSPRCREVFLLSRDDGLTYPQIADTLGISIKTVETLMGRALKSLRSQLAAIRPS